MNFVKKYTLTLIAASLCLSPNQAHGMQCIKNIKLCIVQFGQDSVARIAHSKIWRHCCNFLVTLGQDMVESKSGKVHTLDEFALDRNPGKLKGWTQTKFVLLSCFRLFGNVATGLGVIVIEANNLDATTHHPTNVPENIEPCNIPFPTNVTPPHALQRVCFSSENNSPLCCTLHPDLSLTCCLESAPEECISFNLLDNHDPLFNCCKVTDQGEMICSKNACLSSGASAGPCDLWTEEQNFSDNQTTQGDILQKALEDIYEQMALESETTSHGVKHFSRGIVNFEIPSNVNDQLNSIKTVVPYIRSIQNKFNISPRFLISYLTMGTSTFAHIEHIYATVTTAHKNAGTSPIIDVSLAPSSQIKFARKFIPDDLDIAWAIAHEVAHSHQAELLFYATPMQVAETNPYSSTGIIYPAYYGHIQPGAEISADIMGALASEYKNIATYAIRFLVPALKSMDIRLRMMKDLREADPESNFDEVFDSIPATRFKETSFCQQRLPTVNRENAACINNLLRTDGGISPHPEHNIRATILLKLSTMIKAVVRYLEKQDKKPT